MRKMCLNNNNNNIFLKLIVNRKPSVNDRSVEY